MSWTRPKQQSAMKSAPWPSSQSKPRNNHITSGMTGGRGRCRMWCVTPLVIVGIGRAHAGPGSHNSLLRMAKWLLPRRRSWHWQASDLRGGWQYPQWHVHIPFTHTRKHSVGFLTTPSSHQPQGQRRLPPHHRRVPPRPRFPHRRARPPCSQLSHNGRLSQTTAD